MRLGRSRGSGDVCGSAGNSHWLRRGQCSRIGRFSGDWHLRSSWNISRIEGKSCVNALLESQYLKLVPNRFCNTRLIRASDSEYQIGIMRSGRHLLTRKIDEQEGEAFIESLEDCTMTALAILITGAPGSVYFTPPPNSPVPASNITNASGPLYG